MRVYDKNMKEAQLFWENQLIKSPMAAMTLPLSSQLTSEVDTLEQIEFDLNDIDAQKLDTRCGSNDILIYSYLVAMWMMLMHQYTRNKAIVLGIPSLEKEISKSPINVTLPIWLEINQGMSLKELLHNTKSSLGDVYKYQMFPLTEIASETECIEDQIVIAYEPLHHTITEQSLAMGKDLVVSVYRSNTGFKVRALFRQHFQRKSVHAIITHYVQLLSNSLAHSVDVDIHALSMLTDDEYKQITVDFNSRKCGEFHINSTLDIEFETNALAFAEQEAVKDQNVTWSYRELASQSDHIAARLRSAGLQNGQVVALLSERSVYMVAGLLGILKAGGVFLPLDPELPMERLTYVLSDSGAAMALTSKAQANKMYQLINSVILDETEGAFDASYLKRQYNRPDSLAYIMYTSGSTGTPKGVMIDHSSLVHHIAAYSKYVAPLVGPHNIGLIASYYFDMFIEDVFLGLLNGHTLVVMPEVARLDGKHMMQWAIDNKINIVKATPSQVRILLSAPEEWRTKAQFELFIVGGEALQASLVKQIWTAFANHTPEIVNSYGPTECCIDVTSYRVNKADVLTYQSLPIGAPMKDVGVYITGANFEVLPIGVAGELCLSGHYLANGYIGKTEETEKKFFASPYMSDETLYKTGDLAMWLPDGNIAYLGRVDTQVKVRGQRVELQEIELTLIEIEGVREAAVLHQHDEIIGFVVRDETTSLKHIHSSLRLKLPKYMVPNKFAFLSALPINANGKVDKKALAQFQQFEIEAGHQALLTETEERLAALWKKQLGHINISRDDHFFELGGHSLKAAMLVADIYTHFKKNITIAQLFANPQLWRLAAWIDQTVEDRQFSDVKPAMNSHHYPVSSAQKRLFVLNEYDSGTTTYNMPGAIEIYGKLERERFERTIKTIVERHEVFRTIFRLEGDEVLQYVLDQAEIQIDWLTAITKSITNDLQFYVKPFDLSEAPLLRIQVIQYGEDQYRILFDMHHIISDGGSFQQLVQEFAAIYEGTVLPTPRLQYKDFAVWEQDYFNSEEFHLHERFWSSYLAGELPTLNLAFGKKRGGIQQFDGDRVIRNVSKELMSKLNELSTIHGTTMFMNLTAVYNILLTKYTGQYEQIIGTTISIRNRSEWNDMMGVFLNAVAIRQVVDQNISFTDFLNAFKANVLQVFANNQYPFEQLLETCRIPKEAGRNPLFDTMVIMQHYDTQSELKLSDLRVKPVSFENPISKMDITLEATPLDEGMELCFEYNIHLFDREMIEQLADHFLQLLQDVVQMPSKSIQQLQLMPISEREWHLYESNTTDAPIPSHLIHQLIEDRANMEPETIAVADELSEFSYAELLQRVDTIAQQLLQLGIHKGQLVGIHLDRSIDFIATVLAVLKSGAAYVPIDTDYPVERVEYILSDSGCAAIITDMLQDEHIFSGHRLSTRDLLEQKEVQDSTKPFPELSPDDLAYVIYTSGSTGKPKGAMISHQGLVNYICWAAKVYTKGEKKTFPLYSSISFDLTVTSIFTPLITGGRIEIYAQASKQAIEKIVQDGKVDIVKLTPSHLILLKELNVDNSSIRQLIVGGEMLSMQLVREVEVLFGGSAQVEILNEYGPTETVVGCMIYRVNEHTEGTSVPIGLPADNVKIYILDDNLQPIPSHLIGELYIGGAGVGLGYLNRPDLTSEKFIPNPFEAHGMMYRTGDLATRLSDGNIVYLGRTDDQIKVRGYRIELGEVEHYLNSCDIVSQAVVVAEPEHIGGYQLIAFVVPYVGDPNTVSHLKAELQSKVPSHMIPDRIITVTSIPNTANGKADKKALMNQLHTSFASDKHFINNNYETLEQELMLMWSELLGIDHINVTDNFFQIGGHSLKAIMLLSRLKKKYRVELSLETLFESPTIMELKSLLKDQKNGSSSPVQLEQTASHQVHTSLEADYDSSEEGYDPLEQELMLVWSELLGVERIKVTDNFFHLGGHSLKAIMLLSRLKKKYGVELSLETLFESPTITQLALLLKDQTQSSIEHLKPVPKQANYPLTPSQKRLYFLQHMDQDSAYNIVQDFEIWGMLDKPKFTKALQLMMDRHEALRTSFRNCVEQGAVQVIHEIDTVSLHLIWMKTSEKTDENVIADFEKPFDLSQAPLFRVLVIEEGPERFKVKLNFHHIIFDGVSYNHFITEFSECYKGQSDLSPIQLQYKDYAVWLNDQLQNKKYEKFEQYWLEQLAGELPVLQFPTDYPRPSVKSFEGNQLRFEADQNVSEAFLTLCEKLGITLYMGLVSIFAIALYRYTNQEEIILGTPTSGRKQEELEKLIGMFVNTSILRINVSADDTFNAVVETVKEHTIKMLDYQEYPFEQLVEKLNITRDTSRNPIFDVMFVLQNMDQPAVNIDDEIVIHPSLLEVNKSKFDLTLFAWEEQNVIQFALEYSTKLFKQESIERFSEHVMCLMSATISSPDAALSTLPMLTEREIQQIQHVFNDTEHEVEDITLHRWFEQQVHATPDAIAVVFETTELTFAELNKRANQVCHTLQTAGVKPHAIVGLMVNRSPEMIIGMLGILKAGAAYLPLDPEYPIERINYMLDHSKAKVLLTEPSWLHLLNDQFIGQILNLHNLESIAHQPVDYENRKMQENTLLAYVIYTSGSTGKPKGVLVKHESIVNTLRWRIRYYAFSEKDAILQLPSFSFDSSVEDIFSALLSGAKLVLISAETRLDIPALSKLIIDKRITHFLAVPSFYAMLLQTNSHCLSGVRSITVAGENLPQKLVEDHFTYVPQVRLVNEYGPTECSVCSTAYDIISADQEVSIGWPIDNVQIYIVNANNTILPIGVPGDICISGRGLSSGYLHDDEETAKKIIPNPFRRGELMYRTGDKGKWNADGSIMYLGRADHQVKIRGNRVELEEIERVAYQLKEVQKAAAVVKSNNSGEVLVLYFKSEDEKKDIIIQLKMHLARNLPGFMIPDQFILLNHFPYMPNGKMDRQQLTQREEESPKISEMDWQDEQNTTLEATLMSAWTEVLATTAIKLTDNFFEIGGNSLMLIQLHAKLDTLFPSKLTITDYFAYPTIAAISKYLQSSLTEETTYNRLGIQIPDEYRLTTHNGGGTYTAQVDRQIVNGLLKVIANKNITMHDITSAALFYLIHQHFKTDIVSLYMQLDRDTVQPLGLDLTHIDDFEQLIQAIKKASLDTSIQKVASIRAEELTEQISFLFAHSRSLSDVMFAISDLVLQVVHMDEDMTLILTGSSKISSYLLQELLHYYIQTMSLLSETART